VYPRGGHSRAQVGDGHPGQGDPCRLQQPAGRLLALIVQALLAAAFRAAEQDPEPGVVAGQPDRQRPVAGVVGEDHEHVVDSRPPL
jgi:hypothetical protein